MKKILFILALIVSISISHLPVYATSSYDLVVVREDIPVDYIISSIYASSVKIPLVLVNPDEIPTNVKRELIGYRESGYKNLLIIGGKEAISSTVEANLKSMGFEIDRLWDWNRYGTAARVAVDLWSKTDEVVITDGETYQNFLVAQRVALNYNIPILFVKNSTIPPETRDAIQKLGVKEVFLVGEDETVFGLEKLGLKIKTVEIKPVTVTEKIDTFKSLEFVLFYILLIICIGTILILTLSKLIKRRAIPSLVLTDEERQIANLIQQSHGAIKQSELPKLTDFSRPKISRLIKELENRGIIYRKPIKRTYVVKLKTKIV